MHISLHIQANLVCFGTTYTIGEDFWRARFSAWYNSFSLPIPVVSLLLPKRIIYIFLVTPLRLLRGLQPMPSLFLQVAIRKRNDLHSRSRVEILEANNNVYAAMIDQKVCMKIGDGDWCPRGGEWELATSGQSYAIWQIPQRLLPA
jgi:hypothetical protein